MVFYTVEKISEMLKVHPNTVRNWINKGDLKASKTGQVYRIKKEDFEKFINDRMN